ncbi:late blight resistance protein R1-A-like [Salvia miltiorrhiza]|uniref:late blight resistance protein R1-A-like n=1 Tax=Salvia miltiorrhiza TaxID=226208 RepID=UPI0025AC3F9E|nr:late blight resistance protein R1-A-like [Salvia miltiorrhiza]
MMSRLKSWTSSPTDNAISKSSLLWGWAGLEFLETYRSPVADEADPLEMRIADATYAAEDVIESHIVDMIKLHQSTSIYRMTKIYSGGKASTSVGSNKPHQGLQKVIKNMALVKKEAMKITGVVVEAQLQRSVSASAGFSSRSSIVVGFDDVSLEIMDKLTNGQRNLQVIPIVGMGGIGKTTLAKHVYAQPLIQQHFDICAHATISQNFDTREILCELLSQANKRSKEELSNMSEAELGLALHKYLFRRRFLIVMDDMWSVDAWDEIQRFFPNNGNGSRVVVTTRQSKLSSQLNNNYCLPMKFLDEVSCWDLFSKSVFGEETCPLELEETGKKIVENCRGLPLAIVVVGGLLKKMEQTKGCWESIRKNSSSVVNSADEEFCLKILKISYNHLPVYLKPCFLYMGVFEEGRAVRVSTLVKLLVSEGFLKPITDKSLETTAKEYLNELVDRNLILVHELGSTGNIKFCKLHDLLRDLCCREAGKQGFYNVIGQHKFQGLNRQRCVVIPGGISKEEVHDALRSMPLARSFVFHSEEVVPLPDSELLRTLKAYDRDRSGSHHYLLDDLFEFVNSRYLAVGVHGVSKIPYSVNFLWNLHTLIIFHSTWVDAPYVWGMPQLRHLEFHKGDLYLHDPTNGNTVIMIKLQTLKRVNLSVCSRDTLTSLIPNIKKLEVTGGYLPNLSSMKKLESYRYWGYYAMLVFTFPYSLKKLSLGSDTSHWEVNEEMLEKIGALPLLQKLKLERAEFQEGMWQTREEEFPSLKFLELKWCLLKSWMTESSHFPLLEKLHLYGLRQLEEIPCEIGEISTLQSIHLEYCSESVVESAKAIAEEQEELQFRVVLLKTNQNLPLRSLASPNFLVEIDDF